MKTTVCYNIKRNMEVSMGEEISFIELWLGIKKNIFLIVLCILLGGLFAFAVNKFLITPEFETQTTMIIGRPEEYQGAPNKDLDYNDVMLNQKLVSTYSEIIKSREISEEVIQNLGLKFSYKEFIDKLNVQAVKDTELISITVRDTIPERAMDIANETAEIFQKKIVSIMKVDNVQILDEAVFPKEPVSPKVTFNTIIGLILGGVIATFIAIVKELMDNTVKSTEQIQEEFGFPVLGILPKVKIDQKGGKVYGEK